MPNEINVLPAEFQEEIRRYAAEVNQEVGINQERLGDIRFDPFPYIPQPIHPIPNRRNAEIIAPIPPIPGIDPYNIDFLDEDIFKPKKEIKKPKLSKKEEEESNFVRIDLDMAASAFARLDLGIEESEDVEMYPDYLQAYDKYYDILFKSKA